VAGNAAAGFNRSGFENAATRGYSGFFHAKLLGMEF
jgi:hypothetical protein